MAVAATSPKIIIAGCRRPPANAPFGESVRSGKGLADLESPSDEDHPSRQLRRG